MPQTDTQIMLQRLPTGWALYNGGTVLARYGEQLPNLDAAARTNELGAGYWRQTRWKDGVCTQYVWVTL